MYLNKKINHESLIKCNNSYQGESIEQQMRRTIETKEPIENVAPMIYTEKAKGVMPEYDIRTDRFDVALEAMDKVSKTLLAKREEAAKSEQKIEPAKNE